MPETPEGPKTFELIDTPPKAIVLHCSDPRFQRAFAQFIREDLHLQEGEYVPMIITGSVASLAEPLMMPKEFKFMRERVEQVLEWFGSINRIILINHEDCRHYEYLRNKFGGLFMRHAGHITEKQKRDMQEVARKLFALVAPAREVRLYYARIVGNGEKKIVIEEV